MSLSKTKENYDVDSIFGSDNILKDKVYEGDYKKIKELGKGDIKPVFKGGKFGSRAGFGSKEPIFKEGVFLSEAGLKSDKPVFEGGEFRIEAGMKSIKPTFLGGKFDDKAGANSEMPLFLGGEFRNAAGFESKYPIFMGGKFTNAAGQDSENPIIVGGLYKRHTLFKAKKIKAYVQKAKSITKPVSGWIIVEDVDEVKDLGKDCVLIKLKGKKCKISGKGKVYEISKDELNNCLITVNFKHFKEIREIFPLEKYMDRLYKEVLAGSHELIPHY